MVVDALAALPKASELDITDLFIIMSAEGRQRVRKNAMFEAARQGEILFTGQFGTIAGVPCVYSNLVPKETLYLVNKDAVTFFVKKEGTVEQDRDIESKDNTVVYERHGLVALTDDTRACIIEMNSTYSAVAEPSTAGLANYYEKGTTGLYFKTADTAVDATKTYYTKA